jgi:glutamate/tyrosine decarboxylase-like PLP-dependent enzyme
MSATDETLDPEDWDAVRRLGHRMIDDMIDHLRTVRDRPAWQPMPAAVREALESEPLPRTGTALEEIYESFRGNVLPYPTGNLHPGFFGWVMGNGTATGMLADLLASGMNPHLAGYDQSAAVVERQVVRWVAELMGFPPDSSGLLVSGGTMANLNGLAVGRNEKVPFDLREHGLQASGLPRLTLYGSTETHGWANKACELMGLGRSAFRRTPTDDNYRIDVAACRRRITEDLADGALPFAIIGTVGTVNTGAVDDIAALRALADEFGLWLHVDGAFGALAALAPRWCHIVEAQSTADSLGLDLHKWGYMPFEVACVLVRHPSAQTRTFGQAPAYLTATDRGVANGVTYFADRGLQLSRGFRALKAWMSLKEYGSDRIGRLIQQNLEQAAHLAAMVDAHPDLERLAPVELNIVCFRFAPAGTEPAQLDNLNEEILFRVQEGGHAVPSHTILGGRFALRVCITNHRTTRLDLDRLVSDVVALGRALTGAANTEGA